MRIRLTNYTPEGQLLAPPPGDVSASHPGIGGQPTTDPGYYHRFIFAAASKDELLAKARRFFDLMETVPGYSTLTLNQYEVPLVARLRYGYDIVYAVENPGIR